MLKDTLIEAIIAELQRQFIIHISEEFPNAAYLDIYYSHTLKQTDATHYELKTFQTDNDAGSLPVTHTEIFNDAKLRKWLGGVDVGFLLKTCVEEVLHGPFRLLFPEKKVYKNRRPKFEAPCKCMFNSKRNSYNFTYFVST